MNVVKMFVLIFLVLSIGCDKVIKSDEAFIVVGMKSGTTYYFETISRSAWVIYDNVDLSGVSHRIEKGDLDLVNYGTYYPDDGSVKVEATLKNGEYYSGYISTGSFSGEDKDGSYVTVYDEDISYVNFPE